MKTNDMKILLEMRPALDGHAGIPQASRLLFRGLSKLDGVKADGLLLSSNRVLASGLPNGSTRWSEDRKINRLSRVVVSLQQDGDPAGMGRLRAWFRRRYAPARMVASSLLGLKQPLTRFESAHFKDFVWRGLFARTLPSEDFHTVTQADFRVAQVPWTAMHAVALATRRLGRAVYPCLDTSDYDIVLAETPFPGRVADPTRLVVRYHDAIPLLMPHTISNKAYHQASHYHALRRNVADGAWFACVSDSTRRDLLSVFPEAEPRAVTIPNMVSHHYYPDESRHGRVPDILHVRRHVVVKRRASDNGANGKPLPYLLMVSTIEPRKNHLTLLAAWEYLRAHGFPDLNLVFVGALGWGHDDIVKKFRPWLANGGLHLLEDVPAEELRVLYRHARAIVCPSFGEGFDYSGIEAMCCGGVVAASDIAVHRDVFGDAAEYFSPYSVEHVAGAIARLIGPDSEARRAELAAEGIVVASRYLPERVLPQWQAFLESFRHRHAATPAPASIGLSHE
jgi:glycosyltransferase involved in cell wall biosynthesis